MRIPIGLITTVFLCFFQFQNSQAQEINITVSGTVKGKISNDALPFVSVSLKSPNDSSLIQGTISNEEGLFILTEVNSGLYLIEYSFIGYVKKLVPLFVGTTSRYLDLGDVLLEENSQLLSEVTITGQKDALSEQMDKKTYALDDNVSQSGGSVLQSMQNLPGITTQDGEVQLRGNSQVMILIDGKQTAITGFGNQNGLENLPASAVSRIEIINNPSAKYDANGNAGIINIIMRKEDQEGLNGRVGLTAGLGALWERKANLPGIRPQYQATPKINPSVSLNYRRNRVNFFLQADHLYTETLNKNEFVTRTYDDGSIINQQTKRNRDTHLFSSTAGIDWTIDDANSFTFSGMFNQETIKDYGDQPFYNNTNTEQLRLWQFLEDEVLTAIMGSVAYEYKFASPGHKIDIGFNYTFDREDEKYFFTNTQPTFTNEESFFLIADQKVADFNFDYTRPLRHGLLETGFKFRNRIIPTNMQFNPATSNSVLDTGADGEATYQEIIPAVYGNYTYEVKKWEAELGMRVEYVNLSYEVDPNHNTYSSDGYNYFQPFPNARITYSLNPSNKLSAFYNRRVDRPDEGDIRIFPKYDDAEIIKVGNPTLRPQFTNSLELGFKNLWEKGYFYGALYHKFTDGTITRIASSQDGSNLIYNISQNAGKSQNTGIEVVLTQDLSNHITLNLNSNIYRNQIDAFTVMNAYPVANTFTASEQEMVSGNVKLNASFKLKGNIDAQITGIYLAPDIIPQGTIDARYSVDLGVKKGIQKEKGEVFLNATDIFNTMVIRREFQGDGFSYTSDNFYETQVFRLGYFYKF